jgi:hypothetical protein
MRGYSLLVFRRNSSSWAALVDIWGLMLDGSFSDGACSGIFLSLAPFHGDEGALETAHMSHLLLHHHHSQSFLFLLLYLFFTLFGIGGRRVTSPWPRAALRSFMP